MTAKMLILAVFAYLGMAALELPGLWGRSRKRGELWTVLCLLTFGLALAAATIYHAVPISAYKVVEAVFKPVGTLLFKEKGG